MSSFFVNLGLAVLWLAMTRDLSVRTFLVGFGLGFAMLAIFRPVLGSGDYIRRICALGRFLVIFAVEYLRSAGHTLWLGLFRPHARLHPRLLRYDVADLEPFEQIMLAQAVSLTPGTATVEIAEDGSHLLLHTLDGDDPDGVRTSIDRNLRGPILAFTR